MTSIHICLINGKNKTIDVTKENYFEVYLLLKKEINECRKKLRKLKKEGIIKDIRKFRLNKKTLLVYNARKSLIEALKVFKTETLNTFI